jgi:hypothetical protein
MGIFVDELTRSEKIQKMVGKTITLLIRKLENMNVLFVSVKTLQILQCFMVNSPS